MRSFNDLETVDEQHGICGKNVIFKSISNHKDSKNTAIVGIEVREQQYYCASLYIRCPNTNLIDAMYNSEEITIDTMLEGVIKNFHYTKDQKTFSANYDKIFPVCINNELYLCFHRWFGQDEHIPFEEMFEIIVATYNDVTKAIAKIYWQNLYDKLQEKKKILIDERKYKEFYNECQNDYLSALKMICPHEYERFMLANKLLNCRSKTKNNIDCFITIFQENTVCL